MKNIQHIVLISIFCFGVINLSCQADNGNMKEFERGIAAFKKLSVTDGIDIELTQGETTKLILICEERIQDKIKTIVENNELKIFTDGALRRSNGITVLLTVEELSSINLSSGSDLECTNTFKTDKILINCKSGSDIEINLETNILLCELSSGSDAKIGGDFKESVKIVAKSGSDISARLNGKEINCELHQGSDLDLHGKAASLQIDASGGSDISAKNMIVENCKLVVSGGSDAHVFASKSINIDASSSSDVIYYGSPTTKNINTSGGADVYSR